MRNIHKYALLAIIAISAGLMLWAAVAGMRAPESDKIADTMQLIGQYDENCEPIKDSLKQTLPITTNEEGVLAIKSATVFQMRNAEGLNYIKTVEEIQSVNSAYETAETNYNADCTRLAELETLQAENAKEYKKNAKKYDEERKNLELRIAEYNDKGVAELLAKDREWASRIEGVKGSDFEKESALVVEYMEEQYDIYVAELNALTETLKASQAEFDAALAVFTDVAKAFGIEKNNFATKAKNPNDDQSEMMTDYVSTIDELQKVITDIEKSSDKAVKAEWKNTLKAKKDELTADVLAQVKAYDALATKIVEAQINVDTTADNVATLKKAVAAAKADSENLMALATAVSWNIYWLYFLMLFAIAFVLAGFVLNFIQDPNWIKIGVTTAVVAVVVVIAYLVADSHGWNDGEVLYMLDANGAATDVAFGIGAVDSPDRYIFTKSDYMLTDITIWITYLASILGIAAAVVSSVRGIFKK